MNGDGITAWALCNWGEHGFRFLYPLQIPQTAAGGGAGIVRRYPPYLRCSLKLQWRGDQLGGLFHAGERVACHGAATCSSILSIPPHYRPHGQGQS
jgi:hypothetical protein